MNEMQKPEIPADCPITSNVFSDDVTKNTLEITDYRNGTFDLSIMQFDEDCYTEGGYGFESGFIEVPLLGLTVKDLVRIATTLLNVAAKEQP